jgi:hypothetical protein
MLNQRSGRAKLTRRSPEAHRGRIEADLAGVDFFESQQPPEALYLLVPLARNKSI